jgi:hypothetical protein
MRSSAMLLAERFWDEKSDRDRREMLVDLVKYFFDYTDTKDNRDLFMEICDSLDTNKEFPKGFLHSIFNSEVNGQ